MEMGSKTGGAEDSAANEARIAQPTTKTSRHAAVGGLKQRAVVQDSRFFPALRACTPAACGGEEVLPLSSLLVGPPLTAGKDAVEGAAIEPAPVREIS